MDFEALLADKGYDSDEIIAYTESKGATAIIPPKRNRIVQREYDKVVSYDGHRKACVTHEIRRFHSSEY